MYAYPIDKIGLRRGIHLQTESDPVGREQFDENTIRRGLRTTWLGRNLVYYSEIGSTNDEARRLAEQGAPNGTLVICNHQTAGRGRMARRWMSTAGSSLLLSLILRPSLSPARVQIATMACGLAAADAIEDVAGVQAGLKWPNDLLIGDRKVAGILTEMATIGDKVEFLVVGMGVNVNLEPRSLISMAGEREDHIREALKQDPSLQDAATQATSLMLAAGRPISRLRLLWRFLEELEKQYKRIAVGGSPHKEWAKRMSLLDREIQVTFPGETIIGRAIGVDADGALLIELEDGTSRRILAGDVSLR